MDIATLVGIALGVASIIFGIAGPDISAFGGFLDVKSLFIVFGGGIASTLMSYKLRDVLGVSKMVLKTFKDQKQSPCAQIKILSDLSQQARKDGLLALEGMKDQIENEFLTNALSLIIDGIEPSMVRESMDLDLDNLAVRHEQGQGIFKALAALFPAWGMIGTLIGLVQLLGALDDPSAIGPAMAVALITTLYGSILANYVCTPIANKLEQNSKEEIWLKEIIIEGVLSIQAGENPRMLEHKLKTFLSPSMRKQYDIEKCGGNTDKQQ